jgi:hypothetical protein
MRTLYQAAVDRADSAFRALCLSVAFRRRSPAVAMADWARSYGGGSYQVDAHDRIAGARTAPLWPCSR